MLERDPESHSKINTRDEMCVYRCDPESKQQSQWKSPSYPCPRKAKQVHSNVKSKLIGF
jgi:hypothetical protein